MYTFHSFVFRFAKMLQASGCMTHSSGQAELDALVRWACILVPANDKGEVMFHFLDVEQ